MRAYKIVTTKYELEPEERKDMQIVVNLCNEIVSSFADIDSTDEEDEIVSYAEDVINGLDRILNFFE